MHVRLPESMIISCTKSVLVLLQMVMANSRYLEQNRRTRSTSKVNFPSHPLSLQQATSQGPPGREMSLNWKVSVGLFSQSSVQLLFQLMHSQNPVARSLKTSDMYYTMDISLQLSWIYPGTQLNWQVFSSHFMSVFPVSWPFSSLKITLFYNYFKEVKALRRIQLRKAI